MPAYGAIFKIEFSDQTQDATCPQCGVLIWKSTEHFDRLKELLHSLLGANPNNNTPETSIRDLGVDSLDFIEALIEIQEELGVSIPESEIGNISTISDLIRCLQSHGKVDAE